MNGLAKSLIRLYPAAWRKRYGAEFEAMLEDVPPGWSAHFDLLKGAIRMHFSIPSFPKLALMLSVAGLLVGFGASFMLAPRYISNAVLTHYGEPSDHQAWLERIQAIEGHVLSRMSLYNVIQDPLLKLYPAGVAQLPIEDVIAGMRRDIRIRMVNTSAFEISFTYPDRLKAQATVQALVTRFANENVDIQRQAKSTGGSEELQLIAQLESRIAALEQHAGIPPSQVAYIKRANAPALEVLDPPNLPTDPIYPDRGVIAVIGFVAGFILALIVAIFRRRFQPAPPLPASLA